MSSLAPISPSTAFEPSPLPQMRVHNALEYFETGRRQASPASQAGTSPLPGELEKSLLTLARELENAKTFALCNEGCLPSGVAGTAATLVRLLLTIESSAPDGAELDENLPHVSVTPPGYEELVLEWWSEHRKLTLFITEDEVEFLKSWGPNMHAEMVDGPVADVRTLIHLWRWLRGR